MPDAVSVTKAEIGSAEQERSDQPAGRLALKDWDPSDYTNLLENQPEGYRSLTFIHLVCMSFV